MTAYITKKNEIKVIAENEGEVFILMTMSNKLNADVRLITNHDDTTAELFFNL